MTDKVDADVVLALSKLMRGRCPGCGTDFAEFPEMRHTPEECNGPECTCYEGPGHQQGCPFYGRGS